MEELFLFYLEYPDSVKAWGEIGLDYSHAICNPKTEDGIKIRLVQQYRFIEHLYIGISFGF